MTRPIAALARLASLLAVRTVLAGSALAQTTVPNTFAPNTTARSAEVNANFSALAGALDGKATRIEFNAASASCSPNAQALCLSNVGTSITSMGSISVAAPGAGYILLLMTGDMLINDDIGVVNVGIGSSASAFDTSATVGRARVDYVNNLITFESYAVTDVVHVSAAGTYTYHALAQKNPNFATASISVTARLVALFVPTRM